MKYIQANSGHLSIVDDEDYEWLRGWNWTYSPSGNCLYRRLWVASGKSRPTQYMHFAILEQHALSGSENSNKKMVIIHKDGNNLNNQKINLIRIPWELSRWVNYHKSGTSSYRWVHKHNNKWEASYRLTEGKTTRIGSFTEEIDAAKAADAELRMLLPRKIVEIMEECNAFNFPISK